MLDINKTENEKTLTIKLEGRLDTTTAPILEEEIEDLQDVDMLIFDIESLEYISSAGLRLLLLSQKKMIKSGGGMKVTHTNEMVDEIFDVTGFSDILTIEK